LPPAILSALLAGVLSLSDSGAPLILGYRVASVEILTSFSALFDFSLAARQCLVLAGLALLLAAPVLFLGLPSLAAAVLARQTRVAVPYSHNRLRYAGAFAPIAVLVLGLGPPTLGLCMPAIKSPMLGRAAETIERTWGDTLFYSGGAGLVAVALGAGLAVAVGRRQRLRLAVLGTLLGLFALPPALAGIGVVQLAIKAPPELDWLTRGRFTVALVLGLRFLPIATLAMMRAVGSLSPSWGDAAQLHGVSFGRFVGRIVLPLVKQTIAVSLVLIMILATAEITTVLLLQPPGQATLPVAILTVMANSPEGLVASLCLLYVAGVIVVMAATALLSRWWARRAT
jgi:ABC-type Fe3+ transport system permease subunit